MEDSERGRMSGGLLLYSRRLSGFEFSDSLLDEGDKIAVLGTSNFIPNELRYRQNEETAYLVSQILGCDVNSGERCPIHCEQMQDEEIDESLLVRCYLTRL